MKLLLIFALKISVLIHFDYAEYKTTLSDADAKWVVDCLKNKCDSNSDCKNEVDKQIHGYCHITFDFVDGNPPNDLDRKFIFNYNILLSSGNQYFIKEKDFELKLINKIFDNYNSKKKDWPITKTSGFRNTSYENYPISNCNDINAKESKKTIFKIENNWTDSFYKENNCLNWALNIFTPLQIKNEIDSTPKKYRCDALIDVLTKNKLIYIGLDYADCPKNNREIIALATGNKTDYHFYRKDEGEYWSHKLGHDNVLPSQRDYYYRLIRNPKKSNNGLFESFCGYFIKDKSIDNFDEKSKLVYIQKLQKSIDFTGK